MAGPPRSERRSLAIVTCLAIMLAAVIGISSPQPALAFGLYNRSAAVAYADQWALARNTANYPSFTNDCTNFASQVLQAGGYPKHDGFYQDCVNAWWLDRDVFGNFIWAHAFTVADCQKTFFSNHAQDFEFWTGSAEFLPGGDILQMDLESVGYPTHSRVLVGQGFDSVTGAYGSLMDQHTTDRYRQIWNYGIGPFTQLWPWHVTW